MAKQRSDEEILAYKGKPATAKQEAYADWLIEKLGIEFSGSAKEVAAKEAQFRETVRLADALRMVFQASPENQESLAERRAERAAAADAKATKPAKGKGKAVSEDEDEEEAPKAKPTKKSAAKKSTPPPADDEDEDDTASAPAPKKSAPKKASRSGAAAPF